MPLLVGDNAIFRIGANPLVMRRLLFFRRAGRGELSLHANNVGLQGVHRALQHVNPLLLGDDHLVERAERLILVRDQHFQLDHQPQDLW